MTSAPVLRGASRARLANGWRMQSADTYGERRDGAATFAAFDPEDASHRAYAAALHDRLVAIGFGPREAPALFGLTDLSELRAVRTGYYDRFVLAQTPAGRAARFFCLHMREPDADLRAWLGGDLVRFLSEMAAIVPAQGGWRSVVSASWFSGGLILADARAINVVWPDAEPFPDLVMPPGGDSLGLLRVAPRAPRRALLDLCCGPGTQGLAASGYAERVVGVDLNPRALRFAAFNAAANGVRNAEFLLGDTYAPVGAERFDAILANPPFVPWPDDGDALLFRGGGARGEDVLARILAGAVEHLVAPGAVAVVADLADAESLPERIGAWQGRSWRTLVLLQRRYEAVAYAESHAAHLPEGPARTAEVMRLLHHYAAAGMPPWISDTSCKTA